MNHERELLTGGGEHPADDEPIICVEADELDPVLYVRVRSGAERRCDRPFTNPVALAEVAATIDRAMGGPGLRSDADRTHGDDDGMPVALRSARPTEDRDADARRLESAGEAMGAALRTPPNTRVVESWVD
jgi:hypothetical protein